MHQSVTTAGPATHAAARPAYIRPYPNPLLARARFAARHTQAQAAALLGIPEQLYAFIESGFAVLPLPLARNIAGLYGLPVRQLFKTTYLTVLLNAKNEEVALLHEETQQSDAPTTSLESLVQLRPRSPRRQKKRDR